MARLPEIRRRAPAKINLFLRITGKRPDGYHELFSLMAPVGVYDELTLGFGGRELRVRCPHPGVPEDQSNLAAQAVQAFYRAWNRPVPGLSIAIDKQIPVAAGLGGGSSDAAAVLLGLNQYHQGPFSADQLARIGLSLGADIPFFLQGGPALAAGIGEQLTVYPHKLPYAVVLVALPFAVSTGQVYKNLKLALTKCQKKIKSFSFRKQEFDPGRHLCNDLETVTASMHPEIDWAKQALLENGAQGALMSGSGPSVFGLFANAHIARQAARRLSRRAPDWRIFPVATILESAGS